MCNNKVRLTIIVAADQKNGIGIKNTLPWHLSDDLKRFKSLTIGNTVLMGRNTWFSLPKRPLPDRQNIVISFDPIEEEGAVEVRSIEEAMNACDPETENFVIGGDSIYKQFFPLADRLLLTRVLDEFETDTFIPDVDPEVWQLIDAGEDHTDSKSGIHFRYETYERKKQNS